MWMMGTDLVMAGFEFLPVVLRLNIPYSCQPAVTGQQNCGNRASTWVLLNRAGFASVWAGVTQSTPCS